MKYGIIAILLISGMTSSVFALGKSESRGNDSGGEMTPEVKMEFDMSRAETAVFAGGCFWGVEAVFEMLDGVGNVVSGYSGGPADMAYYRIVGTGNTGHAEAVEIVYDPSRISYETLLEVFFNVAHDPTQFNYQGPDVGTQYRSAVFYQNDDQKMRTEAYIKELEKKKIYKQPIVTQLEKLDEFYPAEDYHQNYLRLNPDQPYIVYWDMPKIRDLEKRYAGLLAEK